MNLVSRKWSLALASTLAAAVLAACGGGSDPAATAPAAQAPALLSAQLQSAAQGPAASGEVTSTPVDTDRAKRADKKGNNVYIVQLEEMPATAYDGRIKGLAATKPNKGQKIDPDAPDVASYLSYLSARHDTVLRGVGNGKKIYSYGYVFNGFAAELTDAQAAKLAMTKGVLAVGKDELRSVDTSSTPNFLGLSGTSGFWNTTGAKGEDVVIGIVDSGIWPESESFTDRTGSNGNASKTGKLDYKNMPHWKGKCSNGDQFNNSDCNQKLIAARYYNAGWGGNVGVSTLFPEEYNSPRDFGGHGTHTASTAGGNGGVTVTGPAAPFGTVSGIAPRARISVYKVCWSVEANGGGCFSSDSVAAIEQAVADGVDVINFSISGSSTNFRDPVEIAFMFAADAGVFVAASAGNSGPASSTVAHPGPWLTTVAAGTHNRTSTGSVKLGNNVTYTGISLAANAVGPAPLIDSTAAALAGANATSAALCFSRSWNGGTPVLDPAKVAGKIVVCDRGTNDRVNKSLAVQEAGGIGMVLVNVAAGTLNADYHAVPTVHLADTVRTAVKDYAATTNATATIAQSALEFSAAAPFTASFSSRGPLLAGGGSLLKPDLIAPGQDILAAVAPPGNSGRSFDIYSGTSMSSPHVAGLAALFKQLYPSWSPMAIKSALMTTGTNVLDGGSPENNPVLIFRQGAGHVKPIAATNPGLVFDSGFVDWLGFLCGTQLPTSFCTPSGIPVLNPSDMNVASIAMGALPGRQTVTRRVTNVTNATSTYTPSYTGMGGFTVAVSPASLTIAPGQTKSFTVTFTRTTATLGTYVGGQLTLADGVHKVRIPMLARPVTMGAPVEVGGDYNVTFGYDGAFSATPLGLVAAAKAAGAVATGGQVDFNVVVPAGTTYARFSLFDSDVSQASDLDMEVYGPAGTLVGSSGGATAAEEVNLRNPAAGTYTVRVVGFAVPTGSANFNLYSWALGSTSAGNMTVTAPAAAVTGQSGAITIATSGLAAGSKYLGAVVYGGTAGLPLPTIVRIDR